MGFSCWLTLPDNLKVYQKVTEPAELATVIDGKSLGELENLEKFRLVVTSIATVPDGDPSTVIDVRKPLDDTVNCLLFRYKPELGSKETLVKTLVILGASS
jgi:hypothetical protein